jgi:hypothetical protein
MIRDDEISHFVVDAGKFLIASLSLGAMTYESPVKGDSFPKKISFLACVCRSTSGQFDLARPSCYTIINMAGHCNLRDSVHVLF